MKKVLALILALLMIIPFASCNQTEEPEVTTSAPVVQTTAPAETEPATEAPTECAHSYTEEITEKPKALKDGAKVLTCSACGDSHTEVIPATKTLKVLAIGNSFSSDATEYLWDIAKSSGVEKIIIGNLYIGGCALDKHYGNIRSSAGAYTYYKNTNGKWSSTSGVSVQKGLADEEWDIVTVQQASGSSGVENSYTPLAKILDFLVENEPNADIYWHLTWAYQQNSTHSSFPTYGSDQMKMYNAILKAYDSKVKPQDRIVGVIPSGTAVQNLRSSYIGDTITRDCYHMSYDYGRYTVALTWFAYLTGGDVDKVEWLPANYSALLKPHLPAIREAVKGALAKPFEVTKVTAAKPAGTVSELETDEDIFKSLGKNMADYTLLNWPREVQSYYNSTHGTEFYSHSTSTASNVPNFISSVLLTKENLPNGSIIIVDKGYQYRPEGWASMTSSNTSSTRPGNVSTRAVEVTDAWWGSFTIRAFNLSATPARAMTKADIAHLRIYLPKSANPVPPVKEPGMPDINDVKPEETKPDTPVDDASAFTSLALNIADYEVLDWFLKSQAYYNSKNGISIYNAQTSTASNIPNFIASKLLTKDDLPIGSVIIVDSGYQYRPEGWITETTKNSSRPGNVTTEAVKVTEAWWGNYTIRAFNLSAVATRAMADEDAVHLRIYVPKK
ncbi:MAG: DUF4886 domain-containing protein [Clostridia bacterium]|nr:DUF4886 domain-containing protein [Clostridia bacterium]